MEIATSSFSIPRYEFGALQKAIREAFPDREYRGILLDYVREIRKKVVHEKLSDVPKRMPNEHEREFVILIDRYVFNPIIDSYEEFDHALTVTENFISAERERNDFVLLKAIPFINRILEETINEFEERTSIKFSYDYKTIVNDIREDTKGSFSEFVKRVEMYFSILAILQFRYNRSRSVKEHMIISAEELLEMLREKNPEKTLQRDSTPLYHNTPLYRKKKELGIRSKWVF